MRACGGWGWALTWSDDGVLQARALQLLLSSLLPEQHAPEQVERVDKIVSANASDKNKLLDALLAGCGDQVESALHTQAQNTVWCTSKYVCTPCRLTYTMKIIIQCLIIYCREAAGAQSLAPPILLCMRAIRSCSLDGSTGATSHNIQGEPKAGTAHVMTPYLVINRKWAKRIARIFCTSAADDGVIASQGLGQRGELVHVALDKGCRGASTRQVLGLISVTHKGGH